MAYGIMSFRSPLRTVDLLAPSLFVISLIFSPSTWRSLASSARSRHSLAQEQL